MLAVTATNHGSMVGSAIRPDGSHQRVFRLPPGTSAALPCGFWSPDAKRLACEGFDDAQPERAGIYTVRASDGQHPVRVTKQRDIPCSYSPDGKRILFLRSTPGQDESDTLMTVNIDGSDPRTVILEKVGGSCDWSPDGKTILSEQGDSLILIDPSGKVTPVPIPGGGRAGRGAFSPDGTHIIFSLKLTNQEDIYTVRTDGTELTQITDTHSDEEFGDWGA
jgi:Tol biopolymer transport system component